MADALRHVAANAEPVGGIICDEFLGLLCQKAESLVEPALSDWECLVSAVFQDATFLEERLCPPVANPRSFATFSAIS